jgi:integrase
MSVYRQPGSPNWLCEFQVRGERVRQSTGTAKKAAAKAFEADLRKQYKARAAGGPVTTTMSLLEAFERYHATVITHGTSDGRNYRYQVGKLCAAFGAGTLLGEITTQRIADWRDAVISDPKRPLMASTANAYLGLLRTVLRKAHRSWKTLPVLPDFEMAGKKNKAKKPPRFLTEAEERELLAASPLYLRQWLRFLLGTGARKTEAIELTWDDIENLQSNAEYAEVLFQHHTKGGRVRRVPLGPTLRDMLVRMRAAQRAQGYTGNRVFLGRDQGSGKKWVEVPNFDWTFNHARDKAGIKGINQHTMRHTYASRLAMSGAVDLMQIRDLLGHSNIVTTQIYAHLCKSRLAPAVMQLERYLAA